MASDADWVEDVKRWYLAGRRDHRTTADLDSSADEAYSVGYEAAHPALQAKNWPDAPVMVGPESTREASE